MIGIIDCDNFFVSCERRRDPSLEGKPVVVLAGTAAVVARSNEAKKMGISMSMPYFKLKERFGENAVIAITGDHHYYKETSMEVMSMLKNKVPQMWQYSIDEAFFDLTGVKIDIKEWGEQLAKEIREVVGVPVSVGIAETKTLAKIASHFAKKYPGYKKCCVIDDIEKRVKALQLTPIEDVWGIGRRSFDKLKSNGIRTAYDLTKATEGWLSLNFSKPLLEMRRELLGEDCIPMRQDAANKSVSHTRTFPKMLETKEQLSAEIAGFAASCAATMRKQHTLARDINVFIATNHYRADLPQYNADKTVKLITPTNLSGTLIKECLKILDSIYKEGYKYKRAGVTVRNITDDKAVQTDLFDYDAEEYEKMHKAAGAADEINTKLGRGTIFMGSQLKSAPSHNGHENSETSVTSLS